MSGCAPAAYCTSSTLLACSVCRCSEKFDVIAILLGFAGVVSAALYSVDCKNISESSTDQVDLL